ncbi:MAG: hypothetical protein KDA96_03825 [Planctomycetaceae bacterium]|nr:hypothetical protein [Planctomycetaceae bacterium]
MDSHPELRSVWKAAWFPWCIAGLVVCGMAFLRFRPVSPSSLERDRPVILARLPSIHGLRGKLRMVHDQSQTPLDVRFAIDLSGQRIRLEETESFTAPWFPKEALLSWRSLHIHDSARTLRVRFTHSQSPVPIEYPPDTPAELWISGPADWNLHPGIWELNAILTLRELVASSHLAPGGRETIEDCECVILKPAGPGSRLQFWLSSEHEFLPKRIQHELTGRELNVRRFAQFRNASDEACWFPAVWTADATTVLSHRVEIMDLEINPTFSDAEFTVVESQLPPGVQIHDANQIRFSHGDKDAWQRLHELEDNERMLLNAMEQNDNTE